MRRRMAARPRWAWELSLFALFFCHQLQTSADSWSELPKQSMHLDVRSREWTALELYEKSGKKVESAYAPYSFSHLPVGDYEIRWQSQQGRGVIPVSLYQNSRILIKADSAKRESN